SVSKLVTDVAVMRLVEQGKIDLDAPVSKYLPTFAPKNPFDDTAVTLRHLMAHRSGLIRESPVGNYFDPTGPTLEKTVGSVNGLPLVYPPGKRIKYSNAAIATVGYVLEKTQGERFETYLKKDVLDRLGMSASAFEATPAVKKQLAEAVMWSVHGREFPAPTFELGMAPAGSMYSTVGDLGKFMSCLFADGQGVLKPETVAAMFTPQFADAGAKSGFGIGFMVGDLDGRKRIGHGGAVYGFATELALLPKEKLGVIVTCSRDVANTVVTRIADDALRMMLAARAGQPLPKTEETTAIPPAEAKELVGRYRGGDRWFDLSE
ncbi:MAG: serine hydrolase domain-containing protein, partial [Gemmataceae bacterium]